MTSRALAGFGAIVAALAMAGCNALSSSPTAPPVPTVGMMHVGTDHNPPSLPTLVTQLGEYGWFDGSPDAVMQQLVGDGSKVNNKMVQLSGEYDGPRIHLIWRNLESDQAGEQAKEYGRENVDVIVAFEDSSIRAAQAVTEAQAEPDRIPVVFLHPSDPVRDNLVQSLSHPGGNLTGVFGARDPIAKQVEYYKEIMPNLSTLLTLVDPTDTSSTALLAQATDAASQLGITLDVRQVSNDTALADAFSSWSSGHAPGTAGAFLVSPSLRLNHTSAAIGDSATAGLPVQAHRKEWVLQDPGALFSLGVDVGPVGTAGARFVDSILRGKAPADLPVEEVPKIQFALSLKRAGQLDITVPQDIETLAEPLVYR